MRLTIVFAVCLAGACAAELPLITTDPHPSPREEYAVSRLRLALASLKEQPARPIRILAAAQTSEIFRRLPLVAGLALPKPESFHLGRTGDSILIAGSDAAGVLYGCLELIRRIEEAGRLPADLDVTDGPAFKIRGTNLFWMKWGSKGYDWPVTRENFPWFFDRALMEKYLDELVANRYNTIYFWTGHPFPYFLQLARYPEARMLGEAELRRNIEHFKWFTQEADRRGIWTVVHFYNIHVSPSFAKAHAHEGVQVQNRASTPLLADYMRYCVSEFVLSYPSVGIMITAGEALNVNQEEYVRDVIIPGIKDSGTNAPLIVRQWYIKPYRYRDIVKPNYGNLFTMMKHNTEMIVSPFPDPRNKTWVALGNNHIINVHLNTDIVPYRWGSTPFIQQMVKNWKAIGANGLHLYPLVCWLWPSSMDRVDPPLSTVERDRVWIEAFGRYTWNPDRPAGEEEKYWTGKLVQRFGSPEAGRAVYEYYRKTGPILPAIQNVINAFNMGWYPTSLGREANLNGILHSDRWEDVDDFMARPLDEVTLDLWEKKYGRLSAEARRKPPLSVKEYVQQSAAGRREDAVAPIELSSLLVDMADQALSGLQSATGSVQRERQEYARFINDSRCLASTARFYRAKLAAAIEKGLYDNSQTREHFDRMLEKLAESVKEYARLEELATPAYRQATDIGEWYQWSDARKGFEEELAFYREQAELRRTGAEVVYIGLDGPMSDATNAFHWIIERQRTPAGWKSQSYGFGDKPFERAKLAVVYDLHSPGYDRLRPQLQAWIEKGGKVLIWDPLARASEDPLLRGIQFWTNTAYRPGRMIAFPDSAHALLSRLSGTEVRLDSVVTLAGSIRATSPDWTELAYTVERNVAGGQFSNGLETFGPRWTSMANPARVPLAVLRQLGSGSVVLAQLGSCSVGARPGTKRDRALEAPEYLGRFAENILKWAGTP